MTVPTPPVEVFTHTHDNPAVPAWFSEVVMVAQYVTHFGILDDVQTQVRLARGRAGQYDVIDMMAVLVGYAVSGAPTLQAFWKEVHPFAEPFMALFGRNHLPHRATLSRFLAAVDAPCLDALRHCFTQAVIHREVPATAGGGLIDRHGQRWLIFDVDATRQAARQRPLATDPQAPPPRRRMDAVCAPGYTGQKRGEVVRTRTTVLNAHTQQWLGTFAGAGNGDYGAELAQACQVIRRAVTAHKLPPAQAILRLDSLYGTVAPLLLVQQAGLGFVTRGHDYRLLDHPHVQACLQRPGGVRVRHPDTQIEREVFEVGMLSDWGGPLPDRIVAARLLVTRYPVPEGTTPSSGGKRIGDMIDELFLTTIPSPCLHAVDVLDLYHQRGAFERVLSIEDDEQAMDRWCSRTPLGQTFWQIVSQWLWNIRLELGCIHEATPLRWTAWSPAPLTITEPADPVPPLPPEPVPVPAPVATYGPVVLAQAVRGTAAPLAGQAFRVVDDHTIQCPANNLLQMQGQRVRPNGDVQVVYRARRADCRACALASACLGRHASGTQPRRVSGVRPKQPQPSMPVLSQPPALPTVPMPTQALRWGDVSGQHIRQTWINHLRRQTTTIRLPMTAEPPAPSDPSARLWTRAERSHRRLDWQARRMRNQRPPTAAPISMEVFGIHPRITTYLGLASAPSG